MADTDAATNAAIEDAAANVDAADDADDTIDDADAGDDSADADVDTGTGDDSGEGDAKPANRRENRVQKLANELKEEREARIRAETRAEERERSQRTYADPNEAARVRQAKLDLMEPAEKENFLMREEIQAMKREQQMASVKTEDAMDKREYASMAKTNPVYAKHAEKVEAILATMRRNGNNAPRETVLKYVIGEAALNAPVKKQTVKAKEAAAERVKTATAAPASVRSEGGASKKGGEETAEDLRQRILKREAQGAT